MKHTRIHYERQAREAQVFDSCSLSSKAWALAYLTVVSWLLLAGAGYAVWSLSQ